MTDRCNPKTLALITGLLLVLAGSLTLLGSDSAHAYNPGKRCGSFKQESYRVVVYKKGAVSCRGAVRVVKSFRLHFKKWDEHGDGSLVNTYWTKGGWRCSQGSGAGGCQKPGRGKLLYETVPGRAAGARPDAVERRGKIKRCGSYKARGARWTTTAQHLGCPKANRISKAVNKNVNQSQIVFHDDGSFSHKKFPEFRCDTGALGGYCRDGKKVVGWSGKPLRMNSRG